MIVRDLPAILHGRASRIWTCNPKSGQQAARRVHLSFIEPPIRHFLRTGTFTVDEAAAFLKRSPTTGSSPAAISLPAPRTPSPLDDRYAALADESQVRFAGMPRTGETATPA
jgi:hypothetical protein